MPERQTTEARRGLRPMIGFAASLFAVWCQILLLATISLASPTIAPDPLDGVPICHLADGTQPAQQTPVQPPHRCALCAICLAHALPSAVLSPAPTLPERHLIGAMRPGEAQPRAPPV